MSNIFQAESAPVPVPLTSFIGREREIETVVALLLRPDLRLLTLTGPGGIGKSRLALRVADMLREAFPGGVGFIPLAPVRDPELVLPIVAQSLNVPDTARRSLLEQLQDYLADKHLLLVLDNLEHQLDAVAPLVAGLLAGCPLLTVLATSRVRLDISGEQVLLVGPLPPETARSLFAIRAQAVEPSFAATDETTPVIDAICTRLDRLPLAIELAAARVSVLPPPALLARLEHRLDLLTGGPRDAPSRQRGMREAIAWSHDLLTEPEQALFRRLGVFPGGFTLEAAEAVAAGDNDALAGVSALLAASLVQRADDAGDEPRFTMLETIREYALERLRASGEDASIREAHARYLVSLAERFWDAPISALETWLQRLRSEIDNIRLALEWTIRHDPAAAVQLAGALSDYWIAFVPLAEGRAWVTRALHAAPEASAWYRARALLMEGWLALDEADLDQAEAAFTDAVALFQELDEPREWARGISFLGQVALARGETGKARTLLGEARTRVEASDPPWPPLEFAIATMNLGSVALVTGDLAEAKELLEQALALHEAGSGPLGIAYGHINLGALLLVQRHDAQAIRHFHSAFSTFADAGHMHVAARALEGLAGSVAASHPDRAASLLGAAASLGHGDSPHTRQEAVVYRHALDATRSGLGEPAFAAAWGRGRTMAWDEVRAEVDALADAIPKNADSFPAPADTHGLSLREREVLRLVTAGHSNRAIAERLSISLRTVENHVAHILTKLDLDSRTAAATWAVRHDMT